MQIIKFICIFFCLKIITQSVYELKQFLSLTQPNCGIAINNFLYNYLQITLL